MRIQNASAHYKTTLPHVPNLSARKNSELKRPPAQLRQSQQSSLHGFRKSSTSNSPKTTVSESRWPFPLPQTHQEVFGHWHGSRLVICVVRKRPSFQTGEGKQRISLRPSSGNLCTSCALAPSTVFFFFSSPLSLLLFFCPLTQTALTAHAHIVLLS